MLTADPPPALGQGLAKLHLRALDYQPFKAQVLVADLHLDKRDEPFICCASLVCGHRHL
jgi:hypothetical protein